MVQRWGGGRDGRWFRGRGAGREEVGEPRKDGRWLGIKKVMEDGSKRRKKEGAE